MSFFYIILLSLAGVFIGVPIYLMAGCFFRDVVGRCVMGLLGMLVDWEWHFEIGSWDDIYDSSAWTIFCKALWPGFLLCTLLGLAVATIYRFGWLIVKFLKLWFRFVKGIYNTSFC